MWWSSHQKPLLPEVEEVGNKRGTYLDRAQLLEAVLGPRKCHAGRHLKGGHPKLEEDFQAAHVCRVPPSCWEVRSWEAKKWEWILLMKLLKKIVVPSYFQPFLNYWGRPWNCGIRGKIMVFCSGFIMSLLSMNHKSHSPALASKITKYITELISIKRDSMRAEYSFALLGE